MQEEEFDDGPIQFQLSDKHERDYSTDYYDKENFRSENVTNILVERFKAEEFIDPKENSLKKFVNSTRIDPYGPNCDYNLLDSPDKSHKHSKSRSRTKEKRNKDSEDGDEIDESYIKTFDNNLLLANTGDNKFLNNVKRKLEGSLSMPKSPEDNVISHERELEETSKSLEWILAKDLDKKQRDEVCKIIGEEDSRPQLDEFDDYDNDGNILEIEEVKRVHFGNSVIRNGKIGQEYNEENNSQSNLGQYVEC